MRTRTHISSGMRRASSISLTASSVWRNAMVAGSALDATELNVPILYAQKIAANVMTTAANRYSVWFCAATSP